MFNMYYLRRLRRYKMNIINSEIMVLIIGTLIAILLRCCVSLHSYSGEGKPPMYGDYEAQRHWMEITYNLPMKEWYQNTTNNDLQYWGLDYPPLTAYHSYICGLIANYINPKFVELHNSRGYESTEHKFFMRYTVIVSDILLYIPSILFYFLMSRRLNDDSDSETCEATKPEEMLNKKRRSKKIKQSKKEDNCAFIDASDKKTLLTYSSIIIALLYPGLILIDHGHFQYNCISLGFTILAITLIVNNFSILGSISFCLALNYKQMELYHALPFFLYLLSQCIPKPGQTTINSLYKLTSLGLTVICTFVIIWLPFLFDIKDTMQVIHRIFPVSRGIFEDKVSNLWCSLNVIYKFRLNFSNEEMLRICTIVTLIGLIPSSADLFLRPNIKKFNLALINSSLSFFLFSFHVHEKSILLVALPVLLHLPNDPFMSFWFLVISSFSMLPLFNKDHLLMAFFSLTIFYMMSFKIFNDKVVKNGENRKSNVFLLYYKQFFNLLITINNKKSKLNFHELYCLVLQHFKKNYLLLKELIVQLIFIVSMLGCLILSFISCTFEPPVKYPDLFSLLVSVYSFLHFISFFAYYNIEQFKIPQSFDYIKKIKTS